MGFSYALILSHAHSWANKNTLIVKMWEWISMRTMIRMGMIKRLRIIVKILMRMVPGT